MGSQFPGEKEIRRKRRGGGSARLRIGEQGSTDEQTGAIREVW